MTRFPIFGGIYPDALPDGRYVCLQPEWRRVLTNAEPLPLPPVANVAGDLANPQIMFSRLNPTVPGLEFAAKAHNAFLTWHYTDGTWLKKADSNGSEGFIFDAAGQLQIITPGPGQPSSGYRYVADDGTLVLTRDAFDSATGLAPALGVTRMFRWTHHRGFTIGQGDAGGCVAQTPDGIVRLLEEGSCEFVQFHVDGDAFSVAITKPGAAVLYFGALSELLTLPVYQPGTTIPPPPPPPIDPPEPPMPPPIVVPDFSRVAADVFTSEPDKVARLVADATATDDLRAQKVRELGKDAGENHPDVLAGERVVNAQKAYFTRRIAFAVSRRDARFGLREKTGGTNAARPVDGKLLATDALMIRDLPGHPADRCQVVDVMSDKNVSWGWNPADTQPRDQWVEALPEGDIPQPPPVDPPPANDGHDDEQDADLAQLTMRVGLLEKARTLAVTHDELIEELFKFRAQLFEDVVIQIREALKTVPLPPDVVRESTHKARVGPVRAFGVNLGTFDGQLVKK